MKKFLYLFTVIIMTSLAFTSCGDDNDDPKVKFQDVTIVCNQTYDIPNGTGTVWTSSNEFIASVSGSTVKAERVGEAIIESDKGSFKVTVTPTSYIYKEPYLKWGASKNTVKSFMNSYTLDEEETNSLTYKGSGSVILYSYSFENDKLKSSGIGLDGDYISAEAMSTFLLERYVPIKADESNYTFYFVSPDEVTLVAMQLKAVGKKIVYLVVYVPVTSSSGSRSTIDFDKYFPEFENKPSAIATAAFEKIKSIF